MLKRRIYKIAAILSVCVCGVAGAALNIDLRATQLNGQPLPSNSTARNVYIKNVGDVVSFDIYAAVTGTNGSTGDDKFVSVSGSIRSSTGTSLRGNLVADVVRSVNGTPGFDGPGFSVGLQQDLDGDGDIDVGSNVDSESANFWSPQYALAPAGAAAGSNSPIAGGVRIGFGSFTVTQVAGVSFTTVNFDGRAFAGAARYVQDGQAVQSVSTDGLQPLQIAVFDPEPVTAIPILGMLCGIARFPRRRRS